MLHFAPEKGLEPRLRGILGDQYVTTDLEMPAVDTQQDITAMTFEEGSFSLIYCSNVLEHVPEDRKAMSELYRVLKPGGLAIVQVPIKGEVTYEDPAITDPDERYKHFGQADHVRFYGRDIRERLEAAGFVVKLTTMLEELELTPKELVKFNLLKRELIHLCRKPA